ncbi:hypothetical protein D3C81_638610 [compost metagenome]
MAGLRNAALALCILSAPAMHSYARDVKKVVVESVALSDIKGVAEEACKVFKPTASQIRTYFSRAYPVDGFWSTNKFYSPCHAKGSVEFSDGNAGQWILTSSGIAELTWNLNGRVVLYRARNGWSDPFRGMYEGPED